MAIVSGVLSSDQITSLIQQASASFQAPITLIQNQEQGIKTELSALGQVQGALSSLQSALSALADVPAIPDVAATVTPSGAATASVTKETPVGTYALGGISLATSQTLVSSGSPSESASLGAGSLTFQVGSGAVQTVSVAAGQDTLAGVAAAIDAADVGVAASVVFDGKAYHLSLIGDGTGAANSFTVSGSGGEAAFTFEPGNQQLTETQAAKDASFTFNGIAVTSGSNTVVGPVPGLTIGLAASGSATIQVNEDASGLVDAAQSVVTAINDVLSTIDSLDSFDPSKGAGPLLGDIGVDILKSEILNALVTPGAGVPPAATYQSLATVGFSVSGGAVTLDTSALTDAANKDFGAVASLLGAFGTASNANVSVNAIGGADAGTYTVDVTSNGASGIVGTVNGQAASGTNGLLTVTGSGPALGLELKVSPGVTGSLGTVSVSQGLFGQLTTVLNATLDEQTGSITGEQSGLRDRLDGMDAQIADLQKAANQQVLMLTQEFAQAQATLSQLSTVSDFLSTFESALFNTNASGG